MKPRILRHKHRGTELGNYVQGILDKYGIGLIDKGEGSAYKTIIEATALEPPRPTGTQLKKYPIEGWALKYMPDSIHNDAVIIDNRGFLTKWTSEGWFNENGISFKGDPYDNHRWIFLGGQVEADDCSVVDTIDLSQEVRKKAYDLEAILNKDLPYWECFCGFANRTKYELLKEKVELLEKQLSKAHERLADAYIKLSGKKNHSSDCSTSSAPAELPGPCDCSTADKPTDGIRPIEFAFKAISHERGLQDEKWGSLEEHPHSIPGWLIILRKELEEAENGWMKNNLGRNSVLAEIVQVAAVATACIQQWGASGNGLPIVGDLPVFNEEEAE